jgi:hypothetical protein
MRVAQKPPRQIVSGGQMFEHEGFDVCMGGLRWAFFHGQSVGLRGDPPGIPPLFDDRLRLSPNCQTQTMGALFRQELVLAPASPDSANLPVPEHKLRAPRGMGQPRLDKPRQNKPILQRTKSLI